MDRIEELEQIAARRRAFAEAERVAAEKANAEYAAAYAAELPKHCKGLILAADQRYREVTQDQARETVRAGGIVVIHASIIARGYGIEHGWCMLEGDTIRQMNETFRIRANPDLNAIFGSDYIWYTFYVPEST